jgi:hypothetical protein
MVTAMTNHKLSENTMNTKRNILAGVGAALACALLAAPAAQAQTVSSSTPTATGTVGTTSSGIIVNRVGGRISTGAAAVAPIAAGPEAVSLSGPVSVTASYIPDPAGGQATMAYFIDATQITGTGASTGSTYVVATGQANSTRPFATSDTIQVTMPFYPNTEGGFLSSRTMLLTLNVNVDAVTHAVTSISSTIGNFTAQ